MAPEKLTTVDVLAQTSFIVQGMLEARAADHGVSLIQTRLLGVLRDREPTITDLAKLLELDKSSTSGLVDRAQRRGLVRRVRSELDRRSVTVSLTDAGQVLVSEVAAAFEAAIEQMLSPLDQAQRESVTRGLERALLSHAAGRGVTL